MRKILLSSIILIIFSVSICIFQLSCKKDVQAQSGNSYVLSPATTSKLGGVIPDGTTISVDANGKISVINAKNTLLFSIMDYNNSDAVEIWLSNFDGSNKQKIPISVPPGFLLSSDAQLTPMQRMLFFQCIRHHLQEYHTFTDVNLTVHSLQKFMMVFLLPIKFL